MTTTQLERRIDITPARDCHDGCLYGSKDCRPGSGGYHGIHGSDLRMYVIGPLGAVQFVVYTGWTWPETTERTEEHVSDRIMQGDHLGNPGALARVLFGPMPADLGYHWLSLPDGSKEWRLHNEKCELLGDRECWYDGSSLNAEGVFETLVRHGIDAVWTRLEAEYATRIVAETEAHS